MQPSHLATSPSTSFPLFILTQTLKAHALFTWVLLAWILDICQRSKRGLLPSPSYKWDLSLIHSIPFFWVLLCYQFLSIFLSLSLSSCFGSLSIEELGATLLLQPLPLVIKEELWRNTGVQDFVWISMLLWGDTVIVLNTLWILDICLGKFCLLS